MTILAPPPESPSTEERGGERPRILLLHGFFSTASAWQPLRAELAPIADTIAPNLPGYGDAHVTGDYTLEAMVEYLLPIVEAEQPTHILGHSMGGIVSLALAARLPNQFAKVGIAGLPVYVNRRDGLRYLHRRGWPFRLILHRHELAHVGCATLYHTRGLWRPAFPRLFNGASPDVLIECFDHCAESHRGGLEQIVFAGLVDELAANVGTPVALVHGGRDKAAPPHRARLVAERHGWEFDYVPRHNHQSVLDFPQWAAQWVTERVLERAPVADGA